MPTSLKNDFLIRRALPCDAQSIHALLASYAAKGLLLPVSKEKIENSANTFLVACDDKGVFGCVALRDFGDSLYEVRSLAVENERSGKGVGSRLVLSLLKEFKPPDGARLFALTYRPAFFQRLGFKLVEKELFPQKIWSDCENCPKKSCCDEQAVSAVLPLRTLVPQNHS